MKNRFNKELAFNLTYLIPFYLGNKLAQIFRLLQGGDFIDKVITSFANLSFIAQHPWLSFKLQDLLIGLIAAGLLKLIVVIRSQNRKKYRKGVEYGSARWGTARDIAPYIDKNPRNNIILTKRESLTMESRPKDPKRARNKNVLVIGGSGSGKTRFFVKPNLMQMHSSYVVTDPKGTILTECGTMLKRNGYQIRVLNTINFKRSMHYNPFAYIHSEKDILKLVNAIIINTKGEGEKAGEDFWIKAERLYYSALIGYIWYEAREREQNFTTLLEMIDASEAREDDESFKNPVDELFDELEEKAPDHFAVRQYKKYKLAAGHINCRRLLNTSASPRPGAFRNLLLIFIHTQGGKEVPMAKKKEKITALYERLSHDDERPGTDDDQQFESNSITNQKQILEAFAKKSGFTNIVHFTDDGISGLRFDRPGFVAMMDEVEAGNVSVVCIKDMSRFGRDYLQVGIYTETLRKNGVRLIALNDAVDTAKGDDEFTPFRNIMNEWYARDTSKKIRSAYQAKNLAGKHTSSAVPYGYRKDKDNKDLWLIDEEAAVIVRRIFDMTMESMGPYQIAAKLSEDHIEIPAYYMQLRGFGLWKTREIQYPYKWVSSTIAHILRNPEYLGHTVNFKTRKHFKDKKSHYVEPSEWTVIENTHPAIIDQETYDNVQRLRNNIRRYPDGWGEAHPLSGLLYCADCGGKMYVHRTNNGKRIAQFTCAEYSKIPVGERCKSQHRIGAEVVLKLISEALKEIVTFSEQDEEAFRKAVRDTLTAQQSTESKDQEKRLAACRSRMSELETMLCKIYEDNTLGKLPNKRYIALDAQYTHEQQELEAEIAALQIVVDMSGNEERSAAKFIALVKRYQGFDEMTTTMLNEFVEKVLIHERDIKGCQDSPQTIEIYFNFIGKFRTPDSTVPLTAEEQIKDEALLAEKAALREKRRLAYQKRRDNGKDAAYQREYQARVRDKKIAAKEAIRAEDRANGVYYLPNQNHRIQEGASL